MLPFKPFDYVEFGYGPCRNGEYEAYRTIVLLQKLNENGIDCEKWKGILINDTAGYYFEHDVYSIYKTTKLIYRMEENDAKET